METEEITETEAITPLIGAMLALASTLGLQDIAHIAGHNLLIVCTARVMDLKTVIKRVRLAAA